MKTAIIYCRVSTVRQADEGVSLEAQEQACRDLCARHGWTVAEVFVERGVSGKRAANRPELAKAIARVCETKGVLVFYSLSRLARSLKDTLNIAEQVKDCAGSLASVTDAIDTTTPTGRVFFAILAAICQFESEINGERVKAANAHTHALKGYRTQGEHPFGWRYNTVTGEREAIPAEQRIIKKVLAIRAKHKTLQATADRLNKLKVPTPSAMRENKPTLWHPETIRRLVMRG